MAAALLDAHCDTLTTALGAGAPLEKNALHLDLARLGQFSPAGQVFAVWGDPAAPPVLEKALRFLEETLRRNPRLALCATPGALRTAWAEGKIAVLVSVEGAEQLGCDRRRLPGLRRRGVSFIHLCWNSGNALCGAALDGGGGLTAAGRDFVRACWDCGIAVDLSHASDETFFDVAELSAAARRPLFAGHSNCRALCPHPRNLTDEMLRTVIASGGAVGLNLCPDFLGLGRDMAAALAHCGHVLDLGGEKSLCLGCDLDGIEALPRGFAGVESLAGFFALLAEKRGEETAQDVFYRNFLGAWEASQK